MLRNTKAIGKLKKCSAETKSIVDSRRLKKLIESTERKHKASLQRFLPETGEKKSLHATEFPSSFQANAYKRRNVFHPVTGGADDSSIYQNRIYTIRKRFACFLWCI